MASSDLDEEEIMYEYYAVFRKLTSSNMRRWRPLDVFTRKVLNEDTMYWTSLNLPVYLHRQQIWIRKKR